jgi:phage/plasmid-associated DNA primase
VVSPKTATQRLEDLVRKKLQEETLAQQEQDKETRRIEILNMNHQQRLAYAVLQKRLAEKAKEALEEKERNQRPKYTWAQMRDAQDELGVREKYPKDYLMTKPQIESAYRKRMLIAHSDKPSGSKELAQKAREAMDLLIHVGTYGPKGDMDRHQM